jgi:hypothetical protein
MSKEIEKTVVDYASISFTTQIGSGPDATNMVVQASVDITKDEGDIDLELDKIACRLERQRVIGEIPMYIENIERCRSQINQMNEDMGRLDAKAQEDWQKSGRKGELKLSKQNEQNRVEVLLNIKKLEDRIKTDENKLNYAIEVRDGKSKIRAVKTA